MAAVGKHFLRIYALLFAFSFVSCSDEDDAPYDYTHIKPPTGELFLKEYHEENKPFYSFTYTKDNLLESMTFHRTRVISYVVAYNDSTGLPETMTAFHRNYKLQMKLHYETSQLASRLDHYRFTVNDEEAFKVSLLYDSLDRVVRTIQASDYELAPTYRDFEWVGNNIKSVKIYSDSNNPDVYPYRYEYTYDKKKNPFATVFKTLGYNIVENFPLCESNWTGLKIYEADKTSPSFTVTNKFSYYSMDYPYDRLTEGFRKQGPKENPVYSMFLYK